MQDLECLGTSFGTDLEKEINLIRTNITAVHLLTKLFLQDMVARDHGTIVNVSSIASFAPGPLMAAYYASKAYVTRLSLAIFTELKKKHSKVKIQVLCPGPVATNFNQVAGVHFSLKPMSSEKVARYTVRKMKGKGVILIPGAVNKCMRILSKIVPERLCARVVYGNQTRKNN